MRNCKNQLEVVPKMEVPQYQEQGCSSAVACLNHKLQLVHMVPDLKIETDAFHELIVLKRFEELEILLEWDHSNWVASWSGYYQTVVESMMMSTPVMEDVKLMSVILHKSMWTVPAWVFYMVG